MHNNNKPTILVCGTVRDCGATLEKDLSRILKALESFFQVHFFLVESDSEDSTVAKLRKLALKTTNFEFRSVGKLVNVYPNRLDRLAFCRNLFMEEFDRQTDKKFLAIADFDGLNKRLSRKSVQAIFNLPSDWGAATANQRARYYDIGALRMKGWVDSDPFVQMRFLEESGMTSTIAHRLAVTSKMIHVPSNLPPLEIGSGYGGFAVYKRESVETLRFDSNEGNEVEFVSFSRQIRRRGFKVYLVPSLINASFTEHTVQFKLRYKLVLALSRPMRNLALAIFGVKKVHLWLTKFKKSLAK